MAPNTADAPASTAANDPFNPFLPEHAVGVCGRLVRMFYGHWVTISDNSLPDDPSRPPAEWIPVLIMASPTSILVSCIGGRSAELEPTLDAEQPTRLSFTDDEATLTRSDGTTLTITVTGTVEDGEFEHTPRIQQVAARL